MTQQLLAWRPIQATTVSRRAVLGTVALAAIGSWAASPPRRAAGSTQTEATAQASLTPPRGPTYVGATSDPLTLLAIVLPEDEPGTAVAYLCRGPALNLWFAGRLKDGVLDLASAPTSGETAAPGSALSILTGSLESGRVTGEVVLPNRTLRFTAMPADGVAGLYYGARDEAGLVHATSSTGATLDARQVALGPGANEAPFLIVGTITLADGRQIDLMVPARTEDAMDFRWIMLASGRMRGSGRRRSEDGTEFSESGADI